MSSISSKPLGDTSTPLTQAADRPPSSQFIIDGQAPEMVVYPASIAEVSRLLKEANENGRAISPVGHGAFLHLGGIPKRYEQALCTTELSTIADYQPTDMTITVGAGMSLAQLQAILGENGQWLPLDPPWPERATVGGVIAANLNGPVRFSQGTVRDFLIGIKVVRADGTLIKGGGQVVKNVAGYDLPKLYCGSFGTLGVIVEATFMIRPRPEAQKTFALTFSSAEKAGEAALKLTGSDMQPFFLELANFSPLSPSRDQKGDAYGLFVGFAGMQEEIDDQRNHLRDVLGGDPSSIEELSGDEAQTLSQALRDFPVSGPATFRCKVSLQPTQLAAFCADLAAEAQRRHAPARLLARAGNGILYAAFEGEAVPDDQILSLVDWVRVHATGSNGFVVVEEIPSALKERANVWGSVGKAFPLMQRLKETLDPNSILNSGRFVGGI